MKIKIDIILTSQASNYFSVAAIKAVVVLLLHSSSGFNVWKIVAGSN